jgi:hypothetical protein
MTTITTTTGQPIPFDPAFERIGDGEVDAIRALQNIFAGMVNTVAEAEGHAHRAVHAKGHAILRGKLVVLDNLPPQLAQGLFGAPATFDVLLRWSSPPPEQLPDSVSTPRAVAVKVLGVPGEHLDAGRPSQSQDFLMVNAPAFARPGPQQLVLVSEAAAAIAAKAPAAKKVASAVLRTVESALEAVGGGSVKIRGVGGEPQRHPLGETYFTQVPFLYGTYMAKFSLAPASPDLLALDGASLSNDADAQRKAIAAFFADAGAEVEWDLRVQLCVDLEQMPLEDASAVWPEELSPYVTVARLTLPRQVSWDPATSPRLEDETAFDPWNALAAHRPLGAINRARRAVMATSRQVRSELNRCPIHEPAPR